MAGFSPVDGTKDLVHAGVVPSELFLIGGGTKTLTLQTGGTLFLGINDWACWENGGAFIVSVGVS